MQSSSEQKKCQGYQALLALATLTLVLCPLKSKATDANAAADAATDVCKALWFLDTLAINIRQAVNVAAANKRLLEQQALALKLAYLSAGGPRRTGYAMLAGLAADQLNEQDKQLKEKEPLYQAAATAISELSSKLKTAATIQNRKTKLTATPTKDADGQGKVTTATTTCSYIGQQEEAVSLQCTIDTTAMPQLAAAKIKLEGLNKVPYPAQGFTATLTSDIYAFGKGTIASASTKSKGDYYCSDGAATSIGGTIAGTNAIGTIVLPKATAHGIAAAAFKQSDTAKDCIQISGKPGSYEHEKTTLLHTVCRASQAPLNIANSALDVSITDFSTGGQHAGYTMAALKGQGLMPESAEELDKTKADEFLKAVFGTKESTIAEDYIKALSENRLSFAGKGKGNKEEANKIAKSNAAGAAIAFFGAKSAQVQATKSAEGEPAKKKDTEDKTDDKKDGDNKTNTNTTTNNSFLIKTSPLLLAFLLF
uniref:Variant surface glycoprotein 618 n=1 Tax=Trypanosoma brucei TaxID=5691 RepID=M4TDN2_9TRYP|nr:variant surface glycoprotein 618 [Trypanosoma brucei]